MPAVDFVQEEVESTSFKVSQTDQFSTMLISNGTNRRGDDMETSERLTRLETEFTNIATNITEIKSDCKEGVRKVGAVEAKLDLMHQLLENIANNMCTKVERAELAGKIEVLGTDLSAKLDGVEKHLTNTPSVDKVEKMVANGRLALMLGIPAIIVAVLAVYKWLN